ncbi:MAG: carboxysome shell carbonic anhydrase, partial [Pseudomonadota bacterium]|nr:carboxysome shell carbonic anhydrase [Pseudomonadota bacterium]
GAKDMDVGIKIFTGLNANRGLPIPVVIRNDYHGHVPGARARAEARCQQLDAALRNRFSDYAERGLLHTLLMVRDCQNDSQADVVGSSLELQKQEAH